METFKFVKKTRLATIFAISMKMIYFNEKNEPKSIYYYKTTFPEYDLRLLKGLRCTNKIFNIDK